jgi:hypothetical protein
MISSAVASSESGTLMPSAKAVARLMTRSNFVGCSTECHPALPRVKSYRHSPRHAGIGRESWRNRRSDLQLRHTHAR